MEEKLIQYYWETVRIKRLKKDLDNGADMTAIDHLRRTHLMNAVMHSTNVEVINLLLSYTEDINQKGGLLDKTALMYAAEWNPNSDVIMTLLKHGADPQIGTKFKYTAWFYIQSNEDLEDTEAYNELKRLTQNS